LQNPLAKLIPARRVVAISLVAPAWRQFGDGSLHFWQCLCMNAQTHAGSAGMPLRDWQFHTDLIGGVPAARWSRGNGNPVLLVHGIGPGTMGLANFAPLLDRLSVRWEVHLIDLIGFGRSGRKTALPFFDITIWLNQIAHVVELFGARPAAIVGNSVGGALALKSAVRFPALRAVIAIGAPADRYPIPAALQNFWSVPRSAEELALALTPMTAAQMPPTPDLVASRFRTFADPTYGEYFAAMLPGTKQSQLDEAALSDAEAAALATPALLIHGREDRAVPAEATVLPLSRRLRRADIVLLGSCGHNVLWERTADSTALIEKTLSERLG
jgi:pimeloyl-ACP methyl ester carboxylesterase